MLQKMKQDNKKAVLEALNIQWFPEDLEYALEEADIDLNDEKVVNLYYDRLVDAALNYRDHIIQIVNEMLVDVADEAKELANKGEK